jgi:MFS family permease
MEPQTIQALAPTMPMAAAENRVTGYSLKALAGSVIGYCMDGFDMLILGFMLAAISADLALTKAQAGSLVTWTLAGAVAGGLIFGALSDHFGRIRVLTWTILVFAAFTGLCAFARGYWDLVAYRVMAGLGLGGEFGIGGWSIRFPVIPPKTLVSISYLFFGTFTVDQIISYVGWEEGRAKRIPVILQRVWPKWFNATLWIILICGIWVLVNAVFSLIKFLWLVYHP